MAVNALYFIRRLYMKKLSRRSRKVLRAIYRSMGITAASLLMQSGGGIQINDDMRVMYGPPPDHGDDIVIQGTVQDAKTKEPIQGVRVSIADTDLYYITNNGGQFVIYVPKRETYSVMFNDVDGLLNGQFREHSINLTLSEAANRIDVDLVKEDAE